MNKLTQFIFTVLVTLLFATNVYAECRRSHVCDDFGRNCRYQDICDNKRHCSADSEIAIDRASDGFYTTGPDLFLRGATHVRTG